MKRWLSLLLMVGGVCRAARSPSDKPVGMVVASNAARLLRTGTDLQLAARPGDLLFAGDKLASDSGEPVIWFCPSAQAIHIGASSSIQVDDRKVVANSGRVLSVESIPFCPVPDVTRDVLERPAFVAREVSRNRLPEINPPNEIAALLPATRLGLETELRRIDSLSGSDPQLRLAARAALLSRYQLHRAAAAAYDELAGRWNTVDWPRALVHEHHELLARGTSSEPAIGGTGNTYALLVGISDYPLLRPDQRLQFADRDAELMNAYLRSPRGGALPPENIRLLRNRDATASAIRNDIAEFLRARATRNDTVILLIAAHGVSGPDGAFILAHDSDPDNLPDTGINMLEIQDLLEGGLEQVGHVLIFVDVCHAGIIGNIQNRNFSRLLQILGRFKGEETFGLLASAPEEKSVESERFGGGHGAFSYFLSRALNGEADEDGDRHVTVSELQAYVYNMVRQATKNRQNPRATGDMPSDRVVIPDVSRPGIQVAGWQPAGTTAQANPREIESPLPAAPPQSSLPQVQEFEKALNAGILLPPEPGNAYDLLVSVRASLSAANPLQLLTLENALRTALENRGQAVLLQYLRGEETPQTREDFERGARWFETALELDPEALVWQSRAWFCSARAMLFQNRYAEARELLERAARIEPDGPYLYNALGLLYLQQAQFQAATAAFQDAIRLAPYWSYPRHNLALTFGQVGSYDRAVQAYRDAQKIAPQAWFIAYNQGLVEERVQRLREAERLFRNAGSLAPGRPEPETALGYLAYLRGRAREAEQHYRNALRLEPPFLPASHNLALLLSDSGRTAEAIDLWRAVLRQEPGFISSRMALAAALERKGRAGDALAEYQEAVRLDPQLTGAELAAARLMARLGRKSEAESIMRRLVDAQPLNAAAWDLLGDLIADADPRNAELAYQRASSLSGGEERRHIDHKRKQLGKHRS